MPEGIKNAVLIYNPTSGRKRHRRFADVEQAGRILKEAGIAAELAPTTGPHAATKMAKQAVEQSRDLVIGCGGDGTINEIINGLAGSQVPLALLPAGTANILAKELGVPWDIPHAARLIPSGVIRRIALGIAVPAPDHLSTGLPRAGRYFLCVAGAGPDGAIVNNVDEILKKNAGVVAYWAEGFRQLFTYGFPDIRVRSKEKQHLATIIVIGRTAHYGGPFKITTGASLFEDTFEILTNSMHSRLGYVTCLPALWLGKLRGKKEIEAWKTTEVICEANGAGPIFAQVDGEPVGPLPVTFRIVPDAISILTPAPRAAPHGVRSAR